MSKKIYGVVRVMNTLTQGTAVAGLEAGSAVLSKEATEAVQHLYPDAIIAVTNHHVVGEQKSVMLNFHFSQIPFPASVYKVCPQYDIAFLHIDTRTNEFKIANFNTATQKLRPIELVQGQSLIYTPDDHYSKVTSVGFPLGTAHQTITKGNITAKDVMHNNIVLYHDSLINPGNSGGALLYKGNLVGINTAIRNSGNVVSIATPFETVQSLIPYLSPNLSHSDLSADAFRQLLSMYHVPVDPEMIISRFNALHCGGLKDGEPVKFHQWFNEHCFNKPESHELLQNVLQHLMDDPDKVHALREEGWVNCGHCTSACQVKPSVIAPDRIVFNEHFSVSTTIPIMDKLLETYGSEGVVITGAHAHEPVEDGQLLVGINGRSLDNYGNFRDNGAPYFTAFKFCPGESVRLKIATTEKSIKCVNYTYDKVSELPLIHAPQLTPYTPVALIQIGGVKVMQMNAAMAKASYPKYLKPPFNNSVVGVVVEVDALSPEWNIQKISPGHLLTKVNGQEMQGSIQDALEGARFVTFESNDNKIIKLIPH